MSSCCPQGCLDDQVRPTDAQDVDTAFVDDCGDICVNQLRDRLVSGEVLDVLVKYVSVRQFDGFEVEVEPLLNRWVRIIESDPIEASSGRNRVLVASSRPFIGDIRVPLLEYVEDGAGDGRGRGSLSHCIEVDDGKTWVVGT